MENIFENPAIKNKIEKLYPGIDDVREEDVNDYISYCDNCGPTVKNYQNFKMFQGLKEKCRIKGIDSIMFRKDVISFHKCHYHEGWNDGHDVDYDYITVNTEYGTFKYTEDHRVLNFLYIRKI